jgi:hypothetical protein
VGFGEVDYTGCVVGWDVCAQVLAWLDRGVTWGVRSVVLSVYSDAIPHSVQAGGQSACARRCLRCTSCAVKEVCVRSCLQGLAGGATWRLSVYWVECVQLLQGAGLLAWPPEVG